MARITRRPAQEVVGNSFYDIFPEARSSRLPGVIADAFQVGSSSILTHTLNALLPLRGEGGDPLLHNIVVRPVSCPQANYCLLQITDVTVAVTRERVLRERQNARYHAIVDSAPDAIITIDESRSIGQWRGRSRPRLRPFRVARTEAGRSAGTGQSAASCAGGKFGRPESRDRDIGCWPTQEWEDRLF